MRKILLSAIALLTSVFMMAGNGSSKANAIDFDWANGHKPALSADSWYRVDLTPLKAEAMDPTLALYLTNLTDETAKVTVKAEASVSFLGTTQSGTVNMSYSIKGKDYQLWSVKSFTAAGREWTLKQMMSLGLSELYLQLNSNKEIALSAKVYETEDIVDDACSKAVDFNWAGESVAAGEKWFRLNLSEVKNADKQLKFVVKNNGSATAQVAFDMSLDCPASAVIEKDWVIAAGAEKEDEFGRVFLDVLKEDYVFLKLTNNQPITLSVEEVPVVVDPTLADINCAAAPVLPLNEEITLNAGAHVYKVLREELKANRGYVAELYVTNNNATAAQLDVDVAFACPVKSVVKQTLNVAAGETVVKKVKGGMLDVVESEWVYIRFTADQDMVATVGMRNTDPCATATPFDWTVGASQEAGTTKWYEMDITSLKQNKQHLYLNFINHENSMALVSLKVALDCEGIQLPMVLPVPAGLNVGQMLDYHLIARSPLNRIYVGVTTDTKIELAAAVKNYIAEDQTPCLNAVDVTYGMDYLHNPGTTWYRMSLDMLRSTADYTSLYMANKGNKRANVTVGLVTDCQYTTGVTVTVPVPAGFELNQVVPNVLGRLIDELARVDRIYNKVETKDVYFEVTTDQPIHLGLGEKNETSACAFAVEFDWQNWEQNGLKLEANSDTWYKVDLKYPLAQLMNGEDIPMVIINDTKMNVNVDVAVSPTCPVFLTIDKSVTIPAKTSAKKVLSTDLILQVLGQSAEYAADKAIVQAYIVHNKLVNLAKKFNQYVPYEKIESLIEKYGDNLTVAGLKDAVANYDQYIPVAELKQQLKLRAEFVAYDVVAPKLDQYGEYIPYDIALAILSQYDKVLGGAINVVKKCATYISIDNLNRLINHCKQHFPMEEMKEAIKRLEQRLSAIGFYCYVNVVTDGELVLTPTAPIEPACPDEPVEYTVAACGSYEWKGVEYTESGVYYDTVKMANCEDAEWLDLTQPIKLSEFTAPWYKLDVSEIIANESDFVMTFDNDLGEETELALEMHYYCSEDGDGFVASGSNVAGVGITSRVISYEDFDMYIGPDYETLYLHNVNADCDVVEVLNLTINQAVATEFSDQFCGTYTWNGQEYTAAGDYQQTFTAINGCDSVVTLHLTQYCDSTCETVYTTNTVTFCGSYTWDGQEYTTAGQYIDTLKTVNGCDSIVTTVYVEECPLPCYETETITAFVCDGAEYVDAKGVKHVISSLVPSTLTWNDTVKTGAACDSIFSYVITPIVAPAQLTEAILATIPGATPVLKAGEAVNVTGTLEAIKAYYASVDTEAIADVNNVTWTAGADAVLAEDATTHTMTLLVEAGCEFEITTTFTFPVEPIVVEGIVGVVKRAVQMGNEVVVLTHETDGTAHLYKVVNGEMVAELSQNGVVVDAENAGEFLALADIAATEDGKLVGVNYIMCQSADNYVDAGYKRGETRFYIWNDLAADATLWFSSKMSSNWFRSKQGYTMALKGNSTNCQILLTGPHGQNGKARFSIYNIIDGNFVEPGVNNNEYYHFHNGAADINSVDMTTVLGTNYELNASPLAKGNWILDGNLIEPYEVIVPEANNVALSNGATLAADLGKKYNGASYVAVGTQQIMVAPYVADGKLAGVKALDITAGLAAAAEVGVANLAAAVEATAAATAVAVNEAERELTVTLVADATVYTLVIKLKDKEKHEATITDFVCDGTEYVDFVTGDTIVISSWMPASQTWTSVKSISATVDSVYTFVITPLVAPVVITEGVLKNIPGATPTVAAGQKPDVAGTIEAIKAYYDAQDTEKIADIESVEWTAGADVVVDCAAKTHNMTLKIVAGCDFEVSTTISIPVASAAEPVETTAVACDSYEWKGKTYTESGDYTFEENCQVEILHLTINKSVAVEETVVACDSYTWNGETYTTSGNYTYTTTAANGCDSVVTLRLTINYSDTVYVPVVACDSYEWNGQTYTASGEYTFNTTTAAGCARLEVLQLTINNSKTVEYNVVACDSYEWNGQVYTTSGDYTYNTTTVAGCDSVEILHLIVNVSTAGTQETTICPGDSYEWNGVIYDAAGVYTTTLTNAAGCDSVATLVLSIQDPDNDAAEYDNVAAVSKYGNRLLLFNLNAFSARYGWTPAEAEVTWFKVVGTMDAAADAIAGAGDDLKVGTGFYYNEEDGAAVSGQYYALVEHTLEGDPCASLWRTVILTTEPAQNAPQLLPTIASPNADLRVLNLNPANVTEIRVYNTTGEVVATYTASQATEFMFKAAAMPGYYMVEVLGEGDKVTLRYIVK